MIASISAAYHMAVYLVCTGVFWWLATRAIIADEESQRRGSKTAWGMMAIVSACISVVFFTLFVITGLTA